MKIGFLFNHDQVHQVAHALPTALAMAEGYPQAEIVVATTNDRLTHEVRRLCERLGVTVPLIQLGLRRRSTRALAGALEWGLPVTKVGVYRDNLDFFRSLDALVVAEKTSLLLKTRYGLKDLKIIHTRHGAGDRAIGFNKHSATFDHVLVSGNKIRQRLIREAGVAPDRMSLIGYPKFDLMPDPAPRLPFQANGKPTVLYNPHPSPHLSSWYAQGRAVLEHFLHDDRYNLIFAPHVMLFHRKFVMTIDKLRIDRAGTIDQRFHDAPNIHIDLGSAASTDMTYTAAADIYLGDVSSQVYEFLHRPRPCVFVDAHATAWQGDANYAHWQAGEVVTGADRLGEVLDRAVAQHDRYRPVQRALFQRSFELTEERSAVRAARAVMSVLGQATPSILPEREAAVAATEGLRVA
ncbi:hypothetical protein [Sphingomonas mollis]|uniref:CDP-glycerol glycerophosphotransferase (TagB/SpsB family) n=1 Tax=Sphingomonas mollis TaxID=2795726 RepID=A0ABS0XTX5_9SPHN|nr:hypothetical protein [Sphingomonas sp. BT553]MBJ6123504.1 hypothetical protein [Sphingomonas sp. BT553]